MKRIIALALVSAVALSGTAAAKSKVVRYSGESDGGVVDFAVKYKKRANGDVEPVRLLQASYADVTARCNDLYTGAVFQQTVGESLPDDPTLREYQGEMWFQTEGDYGQITVDVKNRASRTLKVGFGGYYSASETADCYFGSDFTATRVK